MAIPLVAVAWPHHQVRTEIDRGIDQLLNDPTRDGTESASLLENDFARRLGAGILAVRTQSGTAAEFLILRALGIGPGGEARNVSNGDLATTATISHTDATPTLVDIDPCANIMDPATIKAAITARTRGIVGTHPDSNQVLAGPKRWASRRTTTVRQYAALSALTAPQDCLQEHRAIDSGPRDLGLSGLRKLEFHCSEPMGGTVVFC